MRIQVQHIQHKIFQKVKYFKKAAFNNNNNNKLLLLPQYTYIWLHDTLNIKNRYIVT